MDADGERLLSRRIPNKEPALLELIADVLELGDGDDVVWATDLNHGGPALLIALLGCHGQNILYIPSRTAHCVQRTKPARNCGVYRPAPTNPGPGQGDQPAASPAAHDEDATVRRSGSNRLAAQDRLISTRAKVRLAQPCTYRTNSASNDCFSSRFRWRQVHPERVRRLRARRCNCGRPPWEGFQSESCASGRRPPAASSYGPTARSIIVMPSQQSVIPRRDIIGVL